MSTAQADFAPSAPGILGLKVLKGGEEDLGDLDLGRRAAKRAFARNWEAPMPREVAAAVVLQQRNSRKLRHLGRLAIKGKKASYRIATFVESCTCWRVCTCAIFLHSLLLDLIQSIHRGAAFRNFDGRSRFFGIEGTFTIWRPVVRAIVTSERGVAVLPPIRSNKEATLPSFVSGKKPDPIGPSEEKAQ
jgi:hypothetical protein